VKAIDNEAPQIEQGRTRLSTLLGLRVLVLSCSAGFMTRMKTEPCLNLKFLVKLKNNGGYGNKQKIDALKMKNHKQASCK
jgi:hypothetical protein